MNPPAIEAHVASPFVTHDHVAEKIAFVALARGRNRRAVMYRKWAGEAEKAGDLDGYRRWSALSDKSRIDALNALSFARLEASHG